MPRFVDLIVAIYDRHFTRSQMEQLVAFYESPWDGIWPRSSR
jgi:hypothetical protein